MAGTLIVLKGIVKDYPIVAAANRDENKYRGGKEPQVIEEGKKIITPIDKMGGTWVGLNEDGFVAGLTNKLTDISGEGHTSRGKLVLEALMMHNPEIAISHIKKEVEERRYNNFNLFLADRLEAHVVYYEDGILRTETLGEGLKHVLTYGKINNMEDQKVANTLMLLNESKISANLPINDVIKELMGICSYHNELEHTKSICVHSDESGTLSSTIIAVHKQLMDSRLWHAEGNPCSSKYIEYSSLIQQQNYKW